MPKVLVGLSGGIDSLSSALLLKQKGFQVIGLMLQMFSNANSPSVSYNELSIYAKQVGIELICKNVEKDFEENVINHFSENYIRGLTPNICVFCNLNLKFKTLIQIQKELDCDYIATGHYARVRKWGDRFLLSEAKDMRKDQSYMLSYLTQEILSSLLLPLGELKKDDIKNMMKQEGFQMLSEKRESYGVCFLQEEDYRKFLLRTNPHLSSLKNGIILNKENKIIGYHCGYPFYTIGQHKGIEKKEDKKQYIYEIDAKNNVLRVGEKTLCYRNEVVIKNIHYIKYAELRGEYFFRAKIRGKDEGTMSKIVFENNTAKIYFSKPVFALSKGQPIVIYDKEDIICCGEIEV